MTGWNLPDGCTDAMVDEAFGCDDGEQAGTCLSCRADGVFWDEPRADGSCYECGKPVGMWNERDPDDERDARADWEYERDR